MNDFLLGCENEQSARNLFNKIGKKIQFPSEVEQGIVPFEFIGIVKDYNGVDITQTPDYMEMLCKNYIARHLQYHGWDTKLKLDSSESTTDLLESKKDATNTSIVHTVDKLSCTQSESCASSETSRKCRNYCDPLISNRLKRMHNSDKFSRDS